MSIPVPYIFSNFVGEGNVREYLDANFQFVGGPASIIGGVSILKYLPKDEWPALFARTSIADLSVYVQNALNNERNLVGFSGRVCVNSTLVPRTDSIVQWINRRDFEVRALSAIPILRYPINNVDCKLSMVYFGGAGSSGVTVATTGGTFHDYAISMHVRECDFGFEMDYGINADNIYLDLQDSTFGSQSIFGGAPPSPGTSGFKAIRSFVSGGNSTNINKVQRCRFNAGSNVNYGIDLSGGVGWEFDTCDISYGGNGIRASNIALLDFHHGYSEGTLPGVSLFDTQNFCSKTRFARNNFNMANSSDVHLWNSGAGELECSDNYYNLTGGYPMLDVGAVSRLLPGNGAMRWVRNNVAGANAANRLLTSTQFEGGASGLRFFMRGNTAGAGSITSSTDAFMTISRPGVGQVNITTSHPVASVVANVGVGSTPNVAQQVRCVNVTPTNFTLQFSDGAGAALDTTFTAWGYGS